MTDEEFKTWTRHTAENLQAQRDDAIARIDQRDSEHAALLQSHADALTAKDTAHAEARDKLVAEHAAEVAGLKEDIEALGMRDTEEAKAFRKERQKAKIEAKIVSHEQAKLSAEEARLAAIGELRRLEEEAEVAALNKAMKEE